MERQTLAHVVDEYFEKHSINAKVLWSCFTVNARTRFFSFKNENLYVDFIYCGVA